TEILEIEAWKKSLIEIPSEPDQAVKKSENKKKTALPELQLKPVDFNPNSTTKTEWMEMGIPAYLANTILKYVDKGGRFAKAEDLKKIYGLSENMYNQLFPFIQIPDSKKENPKEEVKVELPLENEEKIEVLDLNLADSISLLNIPGIGPFYAGQIVKYRNRLGGYVSVRQLLELYKMDSVKLENFQPYLTIQDSTLRKIDVNSADFKSLLKHPYFDYEETKKLCNYRSKMGKITGLFQLKKDSVLTERLFKKVEPYLKIE
ncbi:MAG: helix-hairpin-helix domain-containing protein, partial [Bacteroidales bacterium]|nr:helix-hairpin-helix domain-containing protein [Bacteroidales bacterium]